MKRFSLIVLLALFAFNAFAAINAQYDFENGFPHYLKVNGTGTAELSTDKFKDGASSVKFSWTGQSQLVFMNFSDMEASMKVNGAGLMMWVYNTAPMKEPLRFAFIDWSDQEICHFDFNADFTGWRAIWIKYIDMCTADGHYGDAKPKDRRTNVARMTITPSASVSSGTIFIDRVTFAKTKLHNQITPDMQIPQNNWNLERDMWQWCRLWEWEQYPEIEVKPIDESQRQMLRKVEERMDTWAATGNPGKEYTAGTLLKRVDAHFNKYKIGRRPDGSVTGAPLMCDDEFNHGAGEMRKDSFRKLCIGALWIICIQAIHPMFRELSMPWIMLLTRDLHTAADGEPTITMAIRSANFTKASGSFASLFLKLVNFRNI